MTVARDMTEKGLGEDYILSYTTSLTYCLGCLNQSIGDSSVWRPTSMTYLPEGIHHWGSWLWFYFFPGDAKCVNSILCGKNYSFSLSANGNCIAFIPAFYILIS